MHKEGEMLALLLFVGALFLLYKYGRGGWNPAMDSHGTGGFAEEDLIKKSGMMADEGLVLARSVLSNMLIRLKDFCHILLIGGSGSGKGVSVIIVQLLSYFKRGSCVVFDCKGDLLETTGNYRAKRGERILVLGPYTGGKDTLNPLDCIENGPMLIDDAKALAEAIVIRTGTEPDPHWSESAVKVIEGVTAAVLMDCPEQERNLNSVRDITADPRMLERCAQVLIKKGGVAARAGHDIAGLEGKEKAGVMSVVARSLSFCDSELVAKSWGKSTFLPADLCRPGTTLYLQIPQAQLLAARGLLRLWVSTLSKAIIRKGCGKGECLFILDEAAALGSLPALKECLERGRSGGVRLLLAYQSDSQVKSAFEKEPTLTYDNCSTQIYLMPPSGLETATRISDMLGEYTQVVSGYNRGTSKSAQDGARAFEQGTTHGQNEGLNLSVQARKLLDPSEVLRADRN